jgi:hypothetical protein
MLGGDIQAVNQTPEKIFRGFFVFLLNRLDFPVKIVDTSDMRVTTTSDKHNSHERPKQ